MITRRTKASSSFVLEPGVHRNHVHEVRRGEVETVVREPGQYGRTDIGPRVRIVTISMDVADLEEIDLRAKAAGLPRSKYLVRRALDRPL